LISASLIVFKFLAGKLRTRPSSFCVIIK